MTCSTFSSRSKCKTKFKPIFHFRKLHLSRPTCALPLKFRRKAKPRVSLPNFRKGRRDDNKKKYRLRRLSIKHLFRCPFRVRFGSQPRKPNIKLRLRKFRFLRSRPKCKTKYRKRILNIRGSTNIHTGNQHSQIEESTNTLNLSSNTPFVIPYRNSHRSHHSQSEIPQIEPGYQYPFSLTSAEFPKKFYKLHCDDNWRDLSNPSIFNNDSSINLSVSLQGIENSDILDIHGTEPDAKYHPLEHGWSAKNIQTPLPFSSKEILKVVRKHFRERGASSSSIFVPGIWNSKRFSGVSLWDNEEDAVDEGRRFGGGGKDVEVYTVDRDLLRREGSVIFCMEELLGRDSGLCKATKGRYGQRKEKKESGLKGKAYLVVGVIPGTHNIPRIPPVTATKNTNDTSRVKNERESVLVAQTPQRLSSPLISNHIQQDSSTVDFKTSGQQQSDTNILQEQSDPNKKIASISTERTKERTLFDWDLNTGMDPHSHERKRNMQEMREGHRNSAVMGMEEVEEDKPMTRRGIRELRRGNRRSISVVMEAISEDVSVNSHTIHSASSKSSTTSKKSGEEPQSQHQNRSARRIASSAQITRKGTFGTGSLREDILISSELSSPDPLSQNPTMSPGIPGMNSSRNTGTSTPVSRDGYSSEDSLSAGSDIPAIARPKPHNSTAKYLDSSLPTARRAKKFQRTLGGMKVAGSWAEAGLSSKADDLILDYGRTRKPTISTNSKAQSEKKLEERDFLKKKASIDMVTEEWPLKNEQPFTGIGTIAVQRKSKGKGTVADTIDPMERYSSLNSPEPHPASKHYSTGWKARKLESMPESKSILNSKNEEKAWTYKGIVAAGVRNYDGEFKQSYLVEWEGDWAPTWVQKSFTEAPMMAKWEQKCKIWKAQSRTDAGRRLKREKKIERILFDEIPKGKYLLVQYTSDLRPEWVTKSKVDDGIMKEFLEREKTWRYWDGGHGLRKVDSKDGEGEDEESSSAEIETDDDDDDLASDKQKWTEV